MTYRYAKDPQTDRSLRHSVKDGISYSVMIGSGESYFSAFALYFKATTAQIGVLATLPPLLASFAQLLSAWVGRRLKKRKPIIMFGASMQGLALIPLAILPILFPDHAIPILVICAILYFSGANLAIPQWGSMMGDLVAERRRGRFFGRRTRLCSITSFSALILAGITLDLFDRNAYTLTGYVVIFLAAVIARFVSVYHLAQMYDPPGHVAALESPFQRGFWQRVRGSSFARFSIFFAAMQFSVAIASPFFVVYMLRDLHFTYLEFTINIAMSVLIQFLALNRWGRISDAFGNRLILVVTGLTIPLFPLLWVFSTNYVYLLFVQALAGMAWGGYSLSASNYIYDLVPPSKRAMYLAFHNVLTSTAVFSGALIGGYLGAHLPTEMDLFGEHYVWLSALYGVFIISTLMRLTIAILLLPRLKEMRAVRSMTVGGLVFRVARLQDLSGVIFDIIGTKRRKPPPKE
ncbi:MAG TPA: MFS transporter [Gammaproteobacteria bacterium]